VGSEHLKGKENCISIYLPYLRHFTVGHYHIGLMGFLSDYLSKVFLLRTSVHPTSER